MRERTQLEIGKCEGRYRMEGTVTEVSAILVAKTTFLDPFGVGKNAFC